jgi:hypothetical protein
MKERLLGSWRLVSYETTDATGRRGRPYGDAVGRISYDAHGNMAGQVMRPDRASEGPDRIRAAYAGYIAYFGTYEVAPDGASVVHHVQGALNPEWVGGDQVRGLRFDGERLVLSAEVPKSADVRVTHVLTWERC